ncbi:hypothetical protein HA466_0011790 [Hirschfeldia incana]|nr:hypothetical protein HA466_0011790 [Hirschfeldia incana]KAJ0267344.1 hypothetical protein HA466_0011790 [Hirschfeldia incana]
METQLSSLPPPSSTYKNLNSPLFLSLRNSLQVVASFQIHKGLLPNLLWQTDRHKSPLRADRWNQCKVSRCDFVQSSFTRQGRF